MRVPPEIAIIGGGQSAKGILFALAERMARGDVRWRGTKLTVVERSGEFATGLAWSRHTAHEEHLSSLAAPERRVGYGDGQRNQFRRTVELLEDFNVACRLQPHEEVIAAKPGVSGWRLHLASGRELNSQMVIFANGHWTATSPWDGCPGYHTSPWPAGRFADAVFAEQGRGAKAALNRFLILGTYLTAIDAAFTLASKAGTFHSEPEGRLCYVPKLPFRLTLASRGGFLPKVWGLAPAQREPRCFHQEALDRLRAEHGWLPLPALFSLLVRELAGEWRPGREPPSLRAFVQAWKRGVSTENAAEVLRRDIAAITLSHRPWGCYPDVRAPCWQAVLLGALPLISENSHALSGEDQQHFDRNLRSLFFAHTMPLPLESAMRLEAMFRAGVLEVLALGADSRLHPVLGEQPGFRLSWKGPSGVACVASFSQVVNGLGQSADLARSPEPLMRQLLREGLVQRARRPYRHPHHQGADAYSCGGMLVDQTSCAVIPRATPEGASSNRPAATAYAIGPNLLGQFIDAQSIGQIRRDSSRILDAIGRHCFL